jgi:hypothetical protein
MKVGRNDPCPCGSGKKYKKCCSGKDQEESSRATRVTPPPMPQEPSRLPQAPARSSVPPKIARPPLPPPPPLDPLVEKANKRWEEFESLKGEARVAFFLRTLEDAELMKDELAYEMLSQLRTEALESGNRNQFAEWVESLRQRQPEVYEEKKMYLLSWSLEDALAEGREEAVFSLGRELAAYAGDDIDLFNRNRESLEYHGMLSLLAEIHRIAWTKVEDSGNIVPWGISGFAEKACRYEMYAYIESTDAPDPTPAVLLDRIKFYFKDPNEDFIRQFLADVTGRSGTTWRGEDFVLRPATTRKGDWDEDEDEEEESKSHEQGVKNLARLINEFIGYLRREENVSYARGELVQVSLFEYFVDRHKGKLDPQPSMLERAMKPHLKLPKPPRPIHPLCPERVTFDFHIAGNLSIFAMKYHVAAALFQTIPAWLRFLESRHLTSSEIRSKVVANLLPMHPAMQKICSQFKQDPLLSQRQEAWPADAAKGPTNGDKMTR